jgi:hypothetical protein
MCICIWRVSINKHDRIQVVGFKKLIVLCGGFLFMMHCADNVGHEYQIEAVNTKTSPSIDGNLDEPVWQQAKEVILKENRSGNEVSDPRLMTHVMTCYDDSSLYIAFICNDPDIWTDYTQRDEYLWQEEAVEVFIDVDEEPDTYVEIEVSPANVLFDSYIIDPEKIDVPSTAKFDLPGIKTAVSLNGTLNIRDDTDTGWTVEIAVPFRDLVTEKNKNITIDTIIKINFYRVDKNQDMNSAGYAWSPTGARFHKPSVFGTLIFKDIPMK